MLRDGGDVAFVLEGAEVDNSRSGEYNGNAEEKEFTEYRSVLEDKLPRTYEEFSQQKHADPERWKYVSIDYARRMELRNHPETILPNAKNATAPDMKFLGYLFNPDRPKGWTKGKLFSERLGYSSENWWLLQAEILQNAGQYPAEYKESSVYGDKYEQKMILYGVNDNPTNVIVGWICRPDGTVSLTSAYIKEVKK